MRELANARPTRVLLDFGLPTEISIAHLRKDGCVRKESKAFKHPTQ
jgi:hypothetical protein